MTEQRSGNYMTRFHLSPDLLISLMRLHPSVRVRWVYFNEDRMAFEFILDMPHEDRYFVEPADLIPELPVVITRVTGGDGEKLTVTIPELAQEADSFVTSNAKRRKAPSRG
jgi:hypothetical protein